MFCLLMHTFELIQSGVIMKKSVQKFIQNTYMDKI